MSEFRVNNLSNESSNGGPTFTGITTFSSPYFFAPPVGNTLERPENPEPGSIRFNTDVQTLECFRGELTGWVAIRASNDELNGGHRGGHTGGQTDPSTRVDVIDYVTISTLGNAIDFGNLTETTQYLSKGNCGSRSRGLYAGGYTTSDSNTIGYITISSTGNATNFGDLTVAGESGQCCSNQIRGVFGAGHPNPTATNTMSYVTIASTGDAVDYGDLNFAKNNGTATASTTRGIFWGGDNPGSPENHNIEYVTIASTGNATDSGFDVTNFMWNCASCSNATRAIIAGGNTPGTDANNTIEYVTIASLGNPTDFGDLAQVANALSGASSPTRAVWLGARTPTYLNTIQYIEIMTLGNALDFGDLTGTIAYGGSFSNGHGGL